MSRSPFHVVVIGAGLAGSECAYQLARRGINVALIEMRPAKKSPAHHGDGAAELVCSNSLRSNDVFNAVGLLKEEMASLDSLVMRAAYQARVPAGSALAVDRDEFSKIITQTLRDFPNITWIAGEVTGISSEDSGVVIRLADGQIVQAARCVLATGPLTSDPLAAWLREYTGQESLYFYDSIAPIIEADSIDLSIAFKAARYAKGDSDDGDYINCPMTEDQYREFITAVTAAELTEVHDFDKAQFFEGCLPIEEMVRRGPETLKFGPMKPVGLVNPHHPEIRYAAVVQLRQDNLHASLYNMVGFQTRMKWPEQKRIFKSIPGLQNAEFVRLGSMHRNTYVCSPLMLEAGMRLKTVSNVHLAGQVTGCEGYVESAAIGLYVGLTLATLIIKQQDLSAPPTTTSLGALIHHILKADPKDFQPMNINFGLFEPLTKIIHKKTDKKIELLRRANADFRAWYYDQGAGLPSK